MPPPVKLRLYLYKEFYFISNGTVKQVLIIWARTFYLMMTDL